MFLVLASGVVVSGSRSRGSCFWLLFLGWLLLFASSSESWYCCFWLSFVAWLFLAFVPGVIVFCLLFLRRLLRSFAFGVVVSGCLCWVGCFGSGSWSNCLRGGCFRGLAVGVAVVSHAQGFLGIYKHEKNIKTH